MLSGLLAAFSSGVFVIVTVAFGMFWAARWRSMCKSGLFRKILGFVIALTLIYYVGNFFILSIVNYLHLYGGGLRGLGNIYKHGFGVVLVSNRPLENLLVSIAFLVCGGVIVFALHGRKFTPLEQLTGLAVVRGVLGFTVLTMAIPPLLLCIQASGKFGQTRSRPWLTV